MKASVIIILLVASIMIMEMAPEVEAIKMSDNPATDLDAEYKPEELARFDLFLGYLERGLYAPTQAGLDRGCSWNGCCNCSRQKNGECAAVGVGVCLKGSCKCTTVAAGQVCYGECKWMQTIISMWNGWWLLLRSAYPTITHFLLSQSSTVFSVIIPSL